MAAVPPAVGPRESRKPALFVGVATMRECRVTVDSARRNAVMLTRNISLPVCVRALALAVTPSARVQEADAVRAR